VCLDQRPKLIIDDIDEATYSEAWSLPYDIWVNMMEGEEHGIYIFFKITDWCENEYITTTTNSPLIIKDENISELYLDMSDFQERPWDNKFKISANIPDDIDVETLKLYYRYSENDEKWSEWKQYGDNLTEEPFEWEFKVKDGSGYYEFKTEIIDTSGFVYTSPVESARVTLFPTTLVILMIALIVILLAITVFVIKKMKKKKE